MEELISLIEIVSKQKIKKIKIVSEQSDLPIKIRKLYEGISSGKIQSDLDAISQLYPEEKSIIALKKLKSRLKKRLLNSIFFIDLHKPEFTSYKSVKFELHKSWATIRLLLDRGNRSVVYSLLNKGIKLSVKYDLTDLSILFSRELIRHYAYVNPNKSKFQYYENILTQKIELQKKEFRMEHFSYNVSFKYSSTNAPDKFSILQYLNKVSEEVDYIYNNHKSLIVCYNYFHLKTDFYFLSKEYQRCIEISKTALEYFDNATFKNKSIDAKFTEGIVLCYMGLKEYDKALNLVTRNFTFFQMEVSLGLGLAISNFHAQYKKEITSLYTELLLMYYLINN